MFTTPQVAEKLGVRVERIRGLIRSGRLRALNLSPNDKAPRYMIDAADLQRFLEEAGRRRPVESRRLPRRAAKREIDPDAMAILEEVRARRRRRK